MRMIVYHVLNFSIFVKNYLSNIDLIIGFGVLVELIIKIIFQGEMGVITSVDIITIGVGLVGEDVGFNMMII